MDRMTIRAARPDEYSAVERLMKQVHAMHVQWRPDVFAMPEAVLPEDVFAADAADGMLIVAEKAGQVLADNLEEFYSHMSRTTGTLWEYKDGQGSLDHGFASYVALTIPLADAALSAKN